MSMFYEVTSFADLPLVGSTGDIAIVDDGFEKVCYAWLYGTWRCNHNPVYPV